MVCHVHEALLIVYERFLTHSGILLKSKQNAKSKLLFYLNEKRMFFCFDPNVKLAKFFSCTKCLNMLTSVYNMRGSEADERAMRGINQNTRGMNQNMRGVN